MHVDNFVLDIISLRLSGAKTFLNTDIFFS